MTSTKLVDSTASARKGRRTAFLVAGIAVLVLLVLLGILGGWCQREGRESPAVAQAASTVPPMSCQVAQIDKYGGFRFYAGAYPALTGNGFEIGDIVHVRLDGTALDFDAPFVRSYADVPMGSPCLAYISGTVRLQINGGSLVEQVGVAKLVNGRWQLGGGRAADDLWVEFSMGERGGYREEAALGCGEYTDELGDYPSVEAFANFREARGGALAPGRLFRGASPIDPTRGRAVFVDDLAETNGIRAILDLADGRAKVERFLADSASASPYFESLWQAGKVLPLDMAVDFMGDAFAQAVAEGCRFLTRHEGPWLIHCLEGKDRTGSVCAILEMLAGATYSEIVADYMASFENYYHVRPGTRQFDFVRHNTVDSVLARLTGRDDVASLGDEELQASARAYLLRGGLSEDEIEALREGLCGE